MCKDELMCFFARLKREREKMVGLSKVQLSFIVFPDNRQIQAIDGLWNNGIVELSFFSDEPNIYDELATRLFDLSMTHTIRSIETEGVSNVYRLVDYQTSYIKVRLSIAPSDDHTTNIDADVIEEVLGMMKPKYVPDVYPMTALDEINYKRY